MNKLLELEMAVNCGQIFVPGKYHQLSFHAPVGWEMNQASTRIGGEKNNIFLKQEQSCYEKRQTQQAF